MSKDIRVPSAYYSKCLYLYTNSMVIDKMDVSITKDDMIPEPVIIVNSDGKFFTWSRGLENISSYLKYGYVRIIKNCPLSFLRLGKCKGEKCQWYHIQNNTGDCAMVWKLFI